MKQTLLVGIIALLVCTSCAWLGKKEVKTAQELLNDGIHSFNKRNYNDAIESFERLKDWYPFSNLVISAELKIADAHYNLKEYEEAIMAYEEFESLHPGNEAIPYVFYQIGLCYYNRVDTVDRDQTTAKKAIYVFNRLIIRFPQNDYAIKAGEYIKKCSKSLAGHDFYVGFFYYKSKQYKSALYRYKSVISDYPDTGIHHKALQYILLCEAILKDQIETTKTMPGINSG